MKRKIAFFLAAVTAATSIGAFCFSDRNKDILAATDEEIYYFAEGFGTGVNFDEGNNSWTIVTNFDGGVTDTDFMNNSANMAGIVSNNHSSANEPVIRLINGAENDPAVSGDSDYRGGSAMSTEKITLNEGGEFSAKFTISMPDARVNSAQTNGDENAREVGGDGIAFIITTTDNVQGQAGGGIGYYGVDDSIVVELDSYFNGGYCELSSTATAYVNWKFDNQIYANASLNCIRGNITTLDYDSYSSDYNYGEYWDEVLIPATYSAIPANTTDTTGRFDHVGVMVDGDHLNHLGVAYLNAKDPTELVNNVYVNLDSDTANDVTVSGYSAVSDSFTGFTEVDVDDRLFTFWIEYDGTDLYVSYAVGDFLSAVRPDTPQIAVTGNSALADKFVNEEVNIGFTSAIGSSKANHTVHSVMFVNDYVEGGITNTTSYTEKYYVEVTEETDDSITITVDGTDKYYELFESVTTSGVSLGQSVTIRKADENTDLTKTFDGSCYTEADYINAAYSSYSQTDDEVNADGSTVLYRFYTLKSVNYTEKYYVEDNDATSDFIEITDNGETIKYRLDTTATKSAIAGSKADIEDLSANYDDYTEVTYSSYPGSTDSVSGNGDTVLYQFFKKKTPGYTVEYYLEADADTAGAVVVDGKYFVKKDAVSLDGKVGDDVEVYYDGTKTAGVKYEGTSVDKALKSYTNYVVDADAATAAGSTAGTVAADGSLVLKIYYKKAVVSYTEKFYVEDSDATSDYIDVQVGDETIRFRLDKENTVTGAIAGESAEIIDLSDKYTEYNLSDIAGYPGSTDSINEDGSTILYQFFTKEKITTYTVKYCVEIDPSEADDSSIKIGDKYYKIIEGETIVKSEVEGTDVSTSVNNGVAGIVAGDTDVTETFKTLEGYSFDSDATEAHGKSYGIVLPDGSLEIILVYSFAANTNPPAGNGAAAGVAAAIMALAGAGVIFVLKKHK